jgi:para-nitrobenzyl esterase
MSIDKFDADTEIGKAHKSTNRRSFLKQSSLLIAGAQAGALLPLALGSKEASAQTAPRKSSGASSEPIAETIYGKVRGITAPDGINIFKGIPYGGDTGGKNRFMPPTKPTPWKGVRDALEWGSKSPQVFPTATSESMMFLTYARLLGVEREDCLVLNVWTPGMKDGRKRPVMFRIHGGGFSQSTGNMARYWGHASARRGDVVYVTVNHRLGCLGYTHLGDLAGTEYAKSGNVGMLDLVAALEWVRDNIENFGGDPSRVLIFGESGGGMKSSTLMGMPAAKGLFHRAAIESGPGLTAATRENATHVAELFLKQLGLDKSRISELHKLPVDRLLEAQRVVLSARLHPKDPPPADAFRPVLDPEVLPQHMFQPVATPLAAEIPVIIGTTKDEATLFLEFDAELYALDEAGLQTRVRSMARDNADRVLRAYHQVYPNASPTDILIQIVSDARMRAGSVKLAERKVAQGKAPVYMFRLDWRSPAFDGKLGAMHGLTIPFVCDNISNTYIMAHDMPEAHALAGKMNAAWIAFTRSGNPNTKEIPEWPAYNTETRATMIFDNVCRVENDPERDLRLLWREIGAMPL